MKTKKFFKSNEEKEQFLIWVAFLKAGVYKKGTHALQNKRGHCCLGVGCELFIPPSYLELELNSYRLEGGVPAYSQPKAPRWLNDINIDFGDRYGESLADLNDTGWSHPRIADELLEVYKDEL